MAEFDDQRGDKRRVRQQIRAAFDRAAEDYDAAAVLQHQVGAHMDERLDLVLMQPERVLDIGTGTGRGAERLVHRYPRAEVVAADLAPAMVARARRRLGGWWRGAKVPWRGRRHFTAADLEALPFPAASFDLVFSNLTLQWCDPATAFAEVRRVLRPGGLFLFTTFGPDTLHELRSAWAAVDGEAHVNTFVDMHDLGDELVHAGLADPVMDMEYFTLTYPDARGLMRDLKTIGAQTVTGGRREGLMGRRTLASLEAAYEPFRTAEGVLPTTWEVVHGHAWAPETTPAQQRSEDGATTVSLDSLKGTVRRS